jgi:hypothetical protein
MEVRRDQVYAAALAIRRSRQGGHDLNVVTTTCLGTVATPGAM